MASKAIGFLNFKFSADLTSFERAMNKAQKRLKKFGKNVTKAGQTLSRNLTLPILALGAASIKAFDQQAKAETKLLTALKGRSDVQKRLIEQAKELQKTTLFGDEATIESQALLASLGLTEDQIVMLMPQIQNMATALGMDLTAATSLVSKSVSTSTDALARYFDTGLKGVTGQQERAIVLTDALTEKFDGQAEAAALVGAGPLIQMKNQLGDLAEELGEKLMPYVIEFVEWVKKMIKKFDGLSESTKDNIVKWGLILAAIGPVLIIIGKVSVGLGSLIGGFKNLTKWIAANPYLALAAALALVATAVYTYTTRLKGAAKAKQDLLDISKNAIAEAKEEERQLTINLSLARNVELSDTERKKAIAVLNNKLVGLNKTLNLENIANVNVTAAIKEHTDAMLVQAQIAGIEELITQTYKDITTASLDATEALDDMGMIESLHEAQKGIFKAFGGVISGKSIEESIDDHALEIHSNYINDLTEKVNFYKDALVNLKKEATDKGISVSPVLGDAGDLMDLGGAGTPDGDGDKKVKSIEAISLATKELKFELKEYNKEVAKSKPLEEVFDIEPVNKYREVFGFFGGEIADFFGTTLPEMESGLESMVNKLGDNLAQGAEDFAEYGENIKGILRDLIGGLISSGVAAAVSKAITDAAFLPVWAIPVVAGAAAGLARTAFNSLIPAFAAGGLVTGPTTALIGEGSGTSMANPEVVAPLDKLKQYMGGGQNVTVTGRLVGNDIYLSNERTKFNRNRTV